MVKTGFILSVTLACFVAFAFAQAAQEKAGQQVQPREYRPGASGEQLYDYITKKAPYTRWQLWPGTTKLYKGTEPHGALLTTYVNDVALKSIRNKQKMADGSIIVKENYTPDKKLAALTVMYKMNKYNPDAGDWFWLKSSPEGKIEASGKVDGCIACHGKRAQNDYIFTGSQGKGK
jgi:hypothetical protein